MSLGAKRVPLPLCLLLLEDALNEWRHVLILTLYTSMVLVF